MKKIGVAVMAALLMAAVCGCEEGEPPLSTVSDTSVSQAETSVISKNKTDTVSVPSESIPFEEACAILDTCGAKETGLPQSMKDFQKYYFGTVQYYGKAYYSIYPYVESNDQKIFVGTNLLVSCSDGGLVLKKSWLGVYEEVPTGTAAEDLSWKDGHTQDGADQLHTAFEKNVSQCRRKRCSLSGCFRWRIYTTGIERTMQHDCETKSKRIYLYDGSS